MLELYLRGRSMRIIEFFKRLFHREKPIEIKQKKYLNPPKKMKQTYVAKSTNYLDEQYELFQTIQPGYLVFCRMPVCEDNLVDINHPPSYSTLFDHQKGQRLFVWVCGKHKETESKDSIYFKRWT